MFGRDEKRPPVENDQVAIDIVEATKAVHDPNAGEWNEIVLAGSVLMALLGATIEAASHMHHTRVKRDEALNVALGKYHELSTSTEAAGVTVHRFNKPDNEPEKGVLEGTHAATYGFEFANNKHREIDRKALATADDLLDAAVNNPRLLAGLRYVAVQSTASMLGQEVRERVQTVHEEHGTASVLQKTEATLEGVLGRVKPQEGGRFAFLGKVAATGRTGLLNMIPFGNMAFNFAQNIAHKLKGSLDNDTAYVNNVANQLLMRRLQTQELPQGDVRDIEQTLVGIGSAGDVAFPDGMSLSELGQALAVRTAVREWKGAFGTDGDDPSLRYIGAAFGLCAAFDLTERSDLSTLKRAATPPAPAA